MTGAVWRYGLSSFFSAKEVYLNQIVDFVFKIEDNGKAVPLFNNVAIWDILKNIPSIKKSIEIECKAESVKKDFECIGYPFIGVPVLKEINWNGKSALALRVVLNFFRTEWLSAFLVFEVNQNTPNIIFKGIIKNKRSIACDFYNDNTKVNMVAGYLDDRRSKFLVQRFKNINNGKKEYLTSNKLAIISSEYPGDILNVSTFSNNKIIITQRSSTFFEISLPKFQVKSYQIKENDYLRSLKAYR